MLEKAIASRKIPELTDALKTMVVEGWRKDYIELFSKAETALDKVRQDHLFLHYSAIFN